MNDSLILILIFLWGFQNGWLVANKLRQWSRQLRLPPIQRQPGEE